MNNCQGEKNPLSDVTKHFLFTRGRRECSQLTVKHATQLAAEASHCVIALLYQSSAACHRSFSDVCIMLSVLLRSLCVTLHTIHKHSALFIYDFLHEMLYYVAFEVHLSLIFCCVWGGILFFPPTFFGVAAPIWPPAVLLMLPRRVLDASPLSWMT